MTHEATLVSGQCLASRQSAQDVIRDHISRLTHQVADWQTLLDVLPEDMTEEQEGHIWSLVCKLRSRS